MPYTKTTWVNGGAPAINATNLNKIETGIQEAHAGFEGNASDLIAHKADSMPHKTADGGYRWGLRINADLSATLIYEVV